MIAAERILRIRQGGADIAVPVRIEVPVLDRDAWICRFSVQWPEEPIAGHAAALDGVQALLFALERVAILLYASPYHEARTLCFDEPGDGYGFPLPRDSRELAIGLDKTI